ncbi:MULTISPECIES: DUF3224 domain-containing protein [Stenotrophomonas]|jgi:Protein of unknown function (DUF3224)|uniref:DUF3224 domain-containing protein n=1 Tax=Stenotrophomonas pavanii TaxID=487698 RepID=A0A2D0ANI9_9GAMM|nr:MULTISPECIES: DUF3224 domain-containing protein [Stenotrophomonas]MBC9078281.1 DUF3224 domain-containing protein [Stenotrophomonas maltophilia]MBC9090969.1 DUF3224 domain-containing protein [Stenotrophomonas maltophilia]MBH1390799.1 DUF3224 domain-containing protein [Stenotrophomonas maltophilia]MBH1519326.1 DUF3224 domain-containing protein [Stenotrophomonas maltophilia]MBN4943189.1 DUF3224 domain-containing protein [Stenotrophomonas maltophilia]
MQGEAHGTFEVDLRPVGGNDGPIAVMSIDKTFAGDLQGSSVGQMLAFRTPVQGSAGYVAMERVTATLAGRQGGFTLQHTGLMTRGMPELRVVVVPDSGSDGLLGLAGTLEITISEGRHAYRLLYSLPDPQ